MNALLDTHVFLWWLSEPERLSDAARRLLRDPSNQLFFSAASGWEIAIKAGLGKLSLPDKPERLIANQLAIDGIASLPVQLSHALRTASLPAHHRDPFDRLLVAQAQLEKLPIVTADPRIGQYDVRIIW